MNGYLVDTNVPSELTRTRPDAHVVSFLQNIDKDMAFLSVMTVGEICKGIAGLPASHKRTTLEHWFNHDLRSWFADRILPVSEEIAGLGVDLLNPWQPS